MLRFGILALLVLVFWRAFVWLTPLVMVVLVFWAVRLARRFYRLEIAPALRERFLEEELTKCARATLHQKTAAESLVRQMGEDPAVRENLEYAEVALCELWRVEQRGETA